MIRNRRVLRFAACFCLAEIIFQIILPTAAFALTSGPSQPEFSSFEPVSSSNMVDEFSGDFTYNLPVLEVPGPHGSSYPISLSYHSGVTPEEEASWVGYGWTLNPGAINRNARGVPDDFNGQQLTFHNKMPRNWTATVGGSTTFGEAFSVDVKLGFNASLRYNNYRGFGYNAGMGMYLGRGVVALGYSVSDGDGSFSLNVNPTTALNNALSNHAFSKYTVETKVAIEKKNRDGEKSVRGSKVIETKSLKGFSGGSSYGIQSFMGSTKPSIVHRYTGNSYNVSVNVQKNPAIVPVGGTTTLYGSYSYQNNEAEKTSTAYGYLYSANATSESVMDYHVEKETEFNKRDVFLGVPFNDADNFVVTGEGIGGGFRLYNKKAGHFGPQKVESTVDIYNVGGEIAAGWTFGAGVDVGKGQQKMEMGDWNKLSSFASPTDASIDEPVFFRFTNDMGGEWGTNHTDAPLSASVSNKNPSLTSSNFSFNNGERSGRSSYIGYNTNGAMLSVGSFPSVQAYNKNATINELSNRSTAGAELIGELSVTNETGARYLYALPVYNQKEKNLSYSVKDVSASNIEGNFIAYAQNESQLSQAGVKVGQEQESKYASIYLLTEITTPDYIDKGSNGPSWDDWGGYTRFNYNKLTSSSDWYNWRAPYEGVIYNKNSHSDPKDDQGSFSEGEKELYLLHSIETKTHVAIFTTSPRLDSKEASATNAFTSPSTPGNVSMKRLDKIDLYAYADCQQDVFGNLTRDENGSPQPVNGKKPIKTVHFKYNYNLSTGLPNSHTEGGVAGNGKLTLERVYFEYNGISTTRISPYTFQYAYPTPAEYDQYPAKYNSGGTNVTGNYRALLPGEQNPSYNLFNSDAWGNYQKGGQTRFDYMRTWIDQTVTPNLGGFDPAAWNLKVIKLPSGGEIHVQYEQDDYAYVQDREAHAMAPLLGDPGNSDTFYVDTQKMGITSRADKERMRDIINKRYKQEGAKIYFKFLYRLVGLSEPDLQTCNADYISGYASVVKCEVETTGSERLIITIAKNAKNKIPQEICREFVKTQRIGMLDPSGNCVPGMNEVTSGTDKQKALSTVRQLAGFAASLTGVTQLIYCQKLSPSNSYLRVPVPTKKMGGGIRVKRLMMFDKGLEGAVLYGNEYQYETKENGRIISSGVATNEPQTIREENVMVDFIARKNQSLLNKAIAGKDKKQSEGPLGESIMPGPSIGYSRVTIKNIHSGNTSPGFSVSEFYTAKDFPISLASPEKSNTMTSINSPSPEKTFIPGILVNVIKDKSWAAQGFSFVLNSMHGQVKSKTSYNGPNEDALLLAKSSIVSRTSYEFYKPGEKVPMTSSLFGEITMRNPGREVDITFAQKKVVEKSYDANVEGDLEIAIIPAFLIPIVVIYPTAMPSLNLTEGALYTHATSKVVRYPAIVKKTTVFQDGIEHTEENVAFDQWTGKPVVTKSIDEFKGAYLAANVPASWEYPAYTAKYVTEGKSLQSSAVAGQTLSFAYQSQSDMEATLAFAGDVGCKVLGQLTEGDLVDLGSNYLFNVKKINFAKDQIALVRSKSSAPGHPAVVSAVKIVRTGRSNELSENAGSVTFHNADASALSASSIRQPESQRYIASGTDANDGSLFVKDLNDAFANPSLLPLDGPYHHMNLTQYIDQLPEGCSADLMDISVRNVNIVFKDDNDNITLKLATFEILCGSEWKLVRMPE